MKNIPPTPSSPGFLSQQNHHSWFLEKPPETFWAKHASASMRISGAGVLLHCPAALLEGASGGQGGEEPAFGAARGLWSRPPLGPLDIPGRNCPRLSSRVWTLRLGEAGSLGFRAAWNQAFSATPT